MTFGGVVTQPVWLSEPTETPPYVAWTTDTLLPGGAKVVFTVTVNSDLLKDTTITNSVEIASSTFDSDGQNNTATLTTTATTLADLAICKTADPGSVMAGATLTYTLVYTNHGPSSAWQVTISDTLPGGVQFGGVVAQPAGLSGPRWRRPL